jgi:hypothetical protein
MEAFLVEHDRPNEEDRGVSTALYLVSEHVKNLCSLSMHGDVYIDINAPVPHTMWMVV